MYLIVGLGNPGEKYEKTRHNLGFMVVDAVAREWNLEWRPDKKISSLKALKFSEGTEIVLVKPQPFMNASGYAVAQLTRRYKLDAKSLWLVHDDVDLPLGKLKIRLGGAAAGHHGVESVIKELGTDEFVRFRLGIGQAGRDVETYVLKEFNASERTKAKQLIKKTVKAVQVALDKGIERAMNEFNT